MGKHRKGREEPEGATDGGLLPIAAVLFLLVVLPFIIH